MGHFQSKTKSPGKILVYTLEATFAIWFCCNFIISFAFTISGPISNMGYVGLKTRSLDQHLGNFCLHSRGQIADPISMKLDQNVYLSNF